LTTLLIVDDEAIIRNGLVALVWNEIGIDRVLSARNGLEAKETLQRHPVDIILSDIKMSGLDGIGLARFVNENSLDCAMVFLSGYSDFTFAQQAIKYQVCDYILKPMQPQAILDTIAKTRRRLEEKRYSKKVIMLHEDIEGVHYLENQLLFYLPRLSAQMEKVVKIVCEHYNTDIGLSDLSRSCNMTPTYVSRRIKQETGYTFMTILTALRLLMAQYLIKQKEPKMATISEKVNFHDQRYFATVFKKAFGMTPLEFRKNPKEVNIGEILHWLDHEGS
jgi:YesN/AraC family two-component response regulator